MKVLIVCSGNSPDGSKFDLLRHQAFIYEQVVALQKEKVNFEYFYIKGNGIIGYLSSWFKLLKHLRKNHYALVHAHNGMSGIVAILQPFYKTIITFHGSDINQKKTRLISNVVCLLADYRIFVSNLLFENLYIKPTKNYSIVPCGINLDILYPVDKNDARRKLKLEKDKRYILFSSSFTNQSKNYPLAKTAMSHIPEAELLELKNRTREEVNLLLNAVDALLLTSPYEGSSQIVKEAMACNCPIVTTDVGDVRTIIKNTENCYVCSFSPEEIASKIKDILKSNFRTSGRVFIGTYENTIISNKILNIYRQFGIVGSYQKCIVGLWDTTVPGITFDEKGISNYCRIHENLMTAFERGEKGKKKWNDDVKNIKQFGKGKRYDCIIGVSGGTDSSYLLHLAKEYGLRPLAVTLDNGWNSDISVKNIKKVTTSLNIDLETYVIDYEEVKDVLRSQMQAGMPWIDAPTDYAIMSVLYTTARREKVKYILTGADFRSEGKQPSEWTYTDNRQIRHIHRLYGKVKLKTYPLISRFKSIYLSYIKGIRLITPFNFIEYQKKSAQQLLKEKYNWEYYGGHHHENIFTKFAISYWLPKKHNIDKRIITLSAQIVSGEIKLEEALQIIANPPYEPAEMEHDKDYVIKKLGFTSEEFQKIWDSPNKTFKDYPSNYPLIRRFVKLASPFASIVMSQKPKIFFEMEERKNG